MRRVLLVVLALVALVAAAAVSLPLWLGVLLRQAGPGHGLTFAEYQREGYGRFALTGVRYQRPGLVFTAERVAAPAPLAWLWEHTRGHIGEVAVTGWRVQQTPAPAQPASGPSGWVPVRAELEKAANLLAGWVPRARFERGTVTLPSFNATIPLITWQDRRLALKDLQVRGTRQDVTITLPALPAPLHLELSSLDRPLIISADSRGAGITGELRFGGNRAPFSVSFPATGWSPRTATLHAANWKLPGTLVGLGTYYRSVHGEAQLDWHSGRFSIDTHLRGAPSPAQQRVPPLTVDVRAHGDTRLITVEALHLDAPGLHATLNQPVTFDRAGRFQGHGGVFLVDADLSKIPATHATGTARGRAELRSGISALPAVDFDFALTGVHAEGVAIQAARLQGNFNWPHLEVTRLAVTGPSGETLHGQGGWNFATKQLVGGTLDGELRRTTLARWLPASLQFDTVHVTAHAGGPLQALASNGSIRIDQVVLPGVKPLRLAATWHGHGAALDAFTADVQVAHTSVSAAGRSTTTELQLQRLRIAQQGRLLLELKAPTVVAWRPALRVEGLDLVGPKSNLYLDAQYGATGHLRIAAAHLVARWAADVLTAAVPQAQLESVAVTSTWDHGPARYAVALTGTGELPSHQAAQLNLAARGDAHGLRIEALRMSEGNATVVNATGRLPVTLTPGAPSLVHLDEGGGVVLDMHTAPHAEFWQQFGQQTGITLRQPTAQIQVRGTWERPQGDVIVRAAGVSFDRARFHRDLPAITGLDVHLKAVRSGIDLNRFALSVEGQPVTASGHLPFPEGGWRGLAKHPLDAVRAGADARLEIPAARIGAFRAFVSNVLAPTGTISLDARYHDGALTGRLRLHGAATQPLGPLGIVRDIQADLALKGRKLVVQSARAQSGGHPITLGGAITLPVHAGPEFDLSVKADNIPFVRETGLLVRGDLDLKLRTAADHHTELTGTVRLRDSIFMRDFQSLAPHGGGGGGGAAPPYFSVSRAPVSGWRVNVNVVGKQFLRIETPVFNGLASLQFKLLGTLGAPRAIGSVRLDRGNVVMPFATFAVQHGTVRLTEADPVQPQLDIAAATRKYGYDLKLSVTGTADEPKVEFSSSPPLPSDQILLLVMTGVAPNNEVATSATSRAMTIGAYFGKGLLGAGGGESRLNIESGADVSEQGKPTYSISYELAPRWTAIGRYNRFDEYVADAKYQVWPKPPPENRAPAWPKDAAKIDVKGVGWLEGRKLRHSLERVLGAPTATLDTNAIEDTAVMLLSAVKGAGYQQARLNLKVTQPDGAVRRFAFDPTFAHPLPTALKAKEVEFDVTRGVRWHVTSATVTGVTAMSRDKAAGFFYSDDALFNASANAYSPSQLASDASALKSALEHRGYVDARVRARVTGVKNGAVAVAVTVDQGPLWTVGRVEFSRDASAGVTFPDAKAWLGRPLAPTLRQDISNSVRQAFYRAGYPDTEISIVSSPLSRSPDKVTANVRVVIDARPRVRVGHVRFVGNTHTKQSVLRSRVPVQSGQPLNLLALEKARYRISRLGVFDDVQLKLVPDSGLVRDPVFTLQEAPRFKTSVLAGYGAYEQFRAGVEAREQNLFGHAHEARLRLVQSMKSTSFDFRYTIPELLGDNIDGTAEIYALRRREIAFLRKEFGASVGLQRKLPQTGGIASLRYGLGALANSRSALVTHATDKSQINVGSFTLSVTGDRRDHPLDPRHGYNWQVRLEDANPAFGGVARFQRLELSAAYHTAWGHGRWIHIGLSHGVVTTWNGNDTDLPVNRRFYPGGANSIRGYQNGEAAPRDALGRFIGAKSFTLLNLELEQAITPSLSFVVFGDALGETAYLRHYPWDTRLYSVGVGLRYRTVVGPIRLEYGRNVNPRPQDPSGTIQLSIGYPF